VRVFRTAARCSSTAGDHRRYGVSIRPITIIEPRAEIMREAWFYQSNALDGAPPGPKPVTSAPGPADNRAAAVALRYAIALQAKDAPRWRP
jgi:hypothetical protein